jgi:hypothetical protein
MAKTNRAKFGGKARRLAMAALDEGSSKRKTRLSAMNRF